MLLIIIGQFCLIQNSRPSISLIDNIILEVLVQFLVNPLDLAIYLGMVRG